MDKEVWDFERKNLRTTTPCILFGMFILLVVLAFVGVCFGLKKSRTRRRDCLEVLFVFIAGAYVISNSYPCGKYIEYHANHQEYFFKYRGIVRKHRNTIRNGTQEKCDSHYYVY